MTTDEEATQWGGNKNEATQAGMEKKNGALLNIINLQYILNSGEKRKRIKKIELRCTLSAL